MTPRQAEIFDFIREYLAREGWGPTVREIGERVGLKSPATVHRHLVKLEQEGLIERRPNTAGIRLTGGER